MEAKQTHQPRIVKGRVEIWVPHNEGEVAFADHLYKGTYRSIGKSILENKQRVPTGEHIASLLRVAYCNGPVACEQEFVNVRDQIETGWLYAFNRNLWTSRGVYVLQDENAIGIDKSLYLRDLEQMLQGAKELSPGIRFSRNGKVRFAPKESYAFRDHSPDSFAKDGFIIASCGQEGAEKLAEVSCKFAFGPLIYCYDIQEKGRIAQGVSGVGKFDNKLYFNGILLGNNINSSSLGIWK